MNLITVEYFSPKLKDKVNVIEETRCRLAQYCIAQRWHAQPKEVFCACMETIVLFYY